MGETRNLSSGGVLFTADAKMEVGDPIEYLITLPTETDHAGPVRLRCMGKVLRLEPRGDETPRDHAGTVAATVERYEFIRSKK
jgi:hypothetical protein